MTIDRLPIFSIKNVQATTTIQ